MEKVVFEVKLFYRFKNTTTTTQHRDQFRTVPKKKSNKNAAALLLQSLQVDLEVSGMNWSAGNCFVQKPTIYCPGLLELGCGKKYFFVKILVSE